MLQLEKTLAYIAFQDIFYKVLREEVNLENCFRQTRMPENKHVLILLDIGQLNKVICTWAQSHCQHYV
jgi:hypothetical protein